MTRYWTTLLLLFSILIVETLAWVNPAVSNRLATRLDAAKEPTTTSSSRRQWFSQVAATLTAAPALLTAAPAQAIATVAAPPAVCDTAVTVMMQPDTGRKVFILGTAHISSQSADVAGQLVRDVKPDAVFVELDAKRVGRAGSIATPNTSGTTVHGNAVLVTTAAPSPAPTAAPVEPSQQTETATTAEQGKPQFLLPRLDIRQRALQAGSAAVGNAIKGMYSKLNSSGFNAGEEFVVAVREGQKIGSSIVLGDRDVEVTLRRLTEALAQTDLKELMNPDSELEKSMKELLPGQPSPNMSDAEFRQEMSTYVETMKAKDNVRKIMAELKKAAPAIYAALVEERDIYMGKGLDSLNQFSTIVAVMGIAHMEGVENTLEQLGWRQVPVKCPKA